MKFDQPLIKGTLVRRYNRFLADVELESGEKITAHCANPGSMMGLSDPGNKVLLSTVNDPRRRFKHQLEIVYAGRVAVGIHTGRPNSIVAEAITAGKVRELVGYATLRREIQTSAESRLDMVLGGNGMRPCYVEVKNVTLAQDGIGYFPDAITERGTRHLGELVNLVREGNRAMVFFLAQRADVTVFRPADHIDPMFGEALRDALARGVEAVCYRAKVTTRGIEVEEAIPVVAEEN